MHLRQWSERLALGAVAALALTVPGPTRAQTNVGGRLIIPVDEFERGDNELDDLKPGLVSSGGQRARAMTRAQQDGVARTDKAGSVSADQVRQIAETKMPDLNAIDLDGAIAQVVGTARSMGIEVTG